MIGVSTTTQLTNTFSFLLQRRTTLDLLTDYRKHICASSIVFFLYRIFNGAGSLDIEPSSKIETLGTIVLVISHRDSLDDPMRYLQVGSTGFSVILDDCHPLVLPFLQG